MKLIVSSTRLAILFLFVFVVACDQPDLRVDLPEITPSAEPETTKEASSEPVDTASAEASEASEEVSEADPLQPEEPKEPSEPELSVAEDGSTITITGAIRSRIQRDRIVEELGIAFPQAEIVDELELDFSRHPVGWGNRVTDEFLIPYLEVIEDGSVRYAEGIIYLGGKATNPRDSANFQKMAISTFAGVFSRGIENSIEVE